MEEKELDKWSSYLAIELDYLGYFLLFFFELRRPILFNGTSTTRAQSFCVSSDWCWIDRLSRALTAENSLSLSLTDRAIGRQQHTRK